jgi:hypothetical protein
MQAKPQGKERPFLPQLFLVSKKTYWHYAGQGEISHPSMKRRKEHPLQTP